MRCINFDFDVLCQKVIGLCPEAVSIIRCDKIEGGLNRVFIFSLDNGKKIVAKLPFSYSGPRKLTTSSEIATISYCKPWSLLEASWWTQ